MTAALTRRSKVLLVAGAVVLALLLNVAWVVFGPDDAGEGSAIESSVRQVWASKGAGPRAVSCDQAAGRWTCRVESVTGVHVTCPLGGADAYFANPRAALSSSCRTE